MRLILNLVYMYLVYFSTNIEGFRGAIAVDLLQNHQATALNNKQ